VSPTSTTAAGLESVTSLKWKPPSENSIDFRLDLRFPPKATNPHVPDYCAKPIFVLMMNCGTRPEAVFDVLEMPDEEWERCV
jgi:mRNA guanylyltransferase